LKGNFLAEDQGNEILEEVDHVIEENYNKFIIDLSELNFINSSGLSFLLRILTKARRADGDAILTNIPEQLPKLLVITKLNTVFTVSGDNESATKLLTSES